jgi:hypothetical protein
MKCIKTEVYSWRLSQEVKTELEREARRRKISVAALLEEAARVQSRWRRLSIRSYRMFMR